MIIAFIGKIGHGKTTAAKILVRRHGFLRHRMAGPLKDMLRVGFGLTDEHLDGFMKEAPVDVLCGRSARYAMQTLGTEWGRGLIGEDLWLRAWDKTRPGGRVVVDDARFPNEQEFLRSRETIFVKIVRPGYAAGGSEHESEAHELASDHVIINDSSVDHLCRKVDEMMIKIDRGEIRCR